MKSTNNIATIKMTNVPAKFIKALETNEYKYEEIVGSVVVFNTTAPIMRSLFYGIIGCYPQDANVKVTECNS